MPDLPAAASALRVMAFALGVAELQRDYGAVRGEYHTRVRRAIRDYLEGDGPITGPRNEARIAIVEALPAAFYAGYAEASGGAEVERADDAWLTGKLNAELGHIDALFEGLRDLRAGGLSKRAAAAEARARADGYARTLDDIHSEGKLRGDKNKMLTFKGPAGTKAPCKDCAKWNGKRHSVNFWLKRGLIGRYGNPNFACGRWADCKHGFYDDADNLYAE